MPASTLRGRGTYLFRSLPQTRFGAFWLCVVLLCLGVGHGVAEADEKRPALRVLKLRHHETNHPHRDVAGEFRLLSAFARDHGYRLQWQDGVRAAHLHAQLRNGEADLLLADLEPELETDAGSVAGVNMGTFNYAVFGRSGIDAADPRELRGLRVAISLASPMWSYLMQLEQRVDGLAVVVLPDDRSRAAILDGLASGDYDAAVVSMRVNENPVGELSGVRLLFLLGANQHAAWHYASNDAALRDRLDSYVQRYHASQASAQKAFGDLDEIRQRHVLRVITQPDRRNYFLRRGRRAGFEFELVGEFARSNNLAVEFLVADSEHQALHWLRNGVGDLTTTRVSTSAVANDPELVQSRDYFYSPQVIIYRDDQPVADLSALAGKRVAAIENSVQHRALGQMISAGLPIEPVLYGADATQSTLAEAVTTARVDAAVVDAHDLPGLLGEQPRLRAGASLPAQFNYAWTTRAGDRQLGTAIDTFFAAGVRSEIYNVLARRYFGRPQPGITPAPSKLSPYDDLVRRYAETYNFDWRLIVAQMYAESRFDPYAESRAGAQGLMQLLPATAAEFGVDDPFDPESGISGGVRYLHTLRERFEADVAPRERTWFALAAYNVGFDRVRRARAEAVRRGLDGNRWFGHVDRVMRDMARDASICRCGETVVYVRKVRSLYVTYSRLTARLTAALAVADRKPTI